MIRSFAQGFIKASWFWFVLIYHAGVLSHKFFCLRIIVEFIFPVYGFVHRN
jgi:hypothetical protein